MPKSLESNSSRSAVKLQDGLMRLTAPNPSSMTYKGTNTYILGQKELIIIDPGPNSKTHLSNLLEFIPPNAKVSHILVTHSHLDHSELAPTLSKIVNAPTFAFGRALDGQSNNMKDICKMGLVSESRETKNVLKMIFDEDSTVRRKLLRLITLYKKKKISNDCPLLWKFSFQWI